MTELDYTTLCSMVDLLATKDYDADAMVLQLAKTDPKLFCALAKISRPVPVVAWHALVLHNIATAQYVAAIKELRVATGWGLKEAKDVTDEVRWFMHTNKIVFLTDPLAPSNLNWTSAQRSLIDTLCELAVKKYK